MFFDTCPICGGSADLDEEGFGFFKSRLSGVKCPTCGEYKPTQALADRLEDEDYLPDRHRLSAVVREATGRGETLKLNVSNVKELMQEAKLPESPSEKIDWVLAYMLRHSDRFGAAIEFDARRDYPLAAALDADEFKHLLAEVVEGGLCKVDSGDWMDEVYSLTNQGWERARGLGGAATGSTQAFVAMWFDDAMDGVYELGIGPALRECGFDPFCVKFEHHNERIDEFIENEIKRSGLIVADFTGHRQSVYYEVGLARGRGIPVVWTCHADHIDECHFDTRQYNHVLWDEPEDLRAKLVERIKGSGLSRA